MEFCNSGNDLLLSELRILNIDIRLDTRSLIHLNSFFRCTSEHQLPKKKTRKKNQTEENSEGIGLVFICGNL